VCGNDGHLRPHIVWVGEEPLRMDTVYVALANCAMFVSIGNAGGGEPARSFLAEAKRAGAHTLEFAREPTPASAEFDDCVYGKLVETVPDWVKRLVTAG
jgi:NAD-dependent deacetylase